MINLKASRLTVAVAMVVAVMLAAGAVSVASNMGFKMNKAITPFAPPPAATTSVGDNWTSIPYNNPYGNAGALCTQLGLTSTGVIGAPRGLITIITPATGGATNAQCGTASANSTLLPTDGRGVRIRQPNITGAPASVIIVGSHNPSLAITVPTSGAGSIGDYWIGVPYHTTAVNMNDLCLSAGLTSTGAIGAPRALITRINAPTGAAVSAQCGTSTATGTPLVLGEAVRIREPFGPKTFIPAHF